MQKLAASASARAATAEARRRGFQATDKYLGRMCVFRKGRYIAGYAITAEGTDPAPLATALAAKVQ